MSLWVRSTLITSRRRNVPENVAVFEDSDVSISSVEIRLGAFILLQASLDEQSSTACNYSVAV